MADTFDAESNAPGLRGELDVSDAPLTAAVLAAHPCMWPRIHSDVPTGWDAEIASALRALAELSEATGAAIFVAQIKAKLAGLRMYLDIKEQSAGPLGVVSDTPSGARLESSAVPGSVRERASTIVRTAEARCAAICETCGAPGTRTSAGGWLRIACAAHVHHE